MSNGFGVPELLLERLSRPSKTVVVPEPTLLANVVDGAEKLVAV
jgi:hypothetical protein